MSQINIICPIDFSDRGSVAVRYAAQLARQRRGKLIVVHVVEPANDERCDDTSAAAACEAALTRLERFAPAEPSLRCEWLVLQGGVADQIVELAETYETPQIVMATRGRKGYHRVDMGPTAEQVLRRAPCPVVIVNDEDVSGAGRSSRGLDQRLDAAS